MAQDELDQRTSNGGVPSNENRKQRLQRALLEKQDIFDRAIAEGVEQPWWKQFIILLSERRVGLLEALVATDGDLTQRQEDRLRGQIAAYSFIINLDTIGKTTKDMREVLQNYANRILE